MTVRIRLALFAAALVALFSSGVAATGDWVSLLGTFWFTSGALLVLLLTLIDQPYFSAPANVFVNGVTGLLALLLAPASFRGAIWWSFVAAVSFILVSSGSLMLAGFQQKDEQRVLPDLLYRVVTSIGRPLPMFSALFLWGIDRQLQERPEIQATLVIGWMGFVVVVATPLGAKVADLLKRLATKPGHMARSVGHVRASIEPSIVVIEASDASHANLVGEPVALQAHKGPVLAKGVVVDDRSYAGHRRCTVALTETTPDWRRAKQQLTHGRTIHAFQAEGRGNDDVLGCVDVGSEISTLAVRLHPHAPVEAGDLVKVHLLDGRRAYYQIVTGRLEEIAVDERSRAHIVQLKAGQLGAWMSETGRFELIRWLPPAGAPVVTAAKDAESQDTHGLFPVGTIPKSGFKISVQLEDIVTQNAAVLGVTGSGKTYLTLRIVQELVSKGVKVLVLDVTRQYGRRLTSCNPVQLTDVQSLREWLQPNDKRSLAVFDYRQKNVVELTSDLVTNAFRCMATGGLDEGGLDRPPRLCIIFEEAHALIPEWTQTTQSGAGNERDAVNKTSRVILQGRKYGLGCIVISQRTANITKTVLNQCNTIMAFRSFDQTGMEFLRNHMGDDFARSLSSLPDRQFVIVGKASSSVRPVIVDGLPFEPITLPEPATAPSADGEGASASEEPTAADPPLEDPAQTPSFTAQDDSPTTNKE